MDRLGRVPYSLFLFKLVWAFDGLDRSGAASQRSLHELNRDTAARHLDLSSTHLPI